MARHRNVLSYAILSSLVEIGFVMKNRVSGFLSALNSQICARQMLGAPSNYRAIQPITACSGRRGSLFW